MKSHCPIKTHRTMRGFVPASRQQGVSLITAIFLIVVLAALAAAVVSISAIHQAGAALDILGTRAYHAARAGIEWGLYRQLQPTPAASCFAASTFALPVTSSLSGFTVTVSCSLTTGPGSLQRWQIISTACNQPGPVCPNPNPAARRDYVQRVVQVEF